MQTHNRRTIEALLPTPTSLQAMDLGFRSQPQTSDFCLDLTFCCCPDRPLCAPSFIGRHYELLLLLGGAMDIKLERYRFDVVVIGAGGAGLRAAVEARQAGLRTAIICKSLFGKAHTVMAEGGAAAAMGNVNDNDSWKVHFRDTMRGGKFLNNWRMAELHAKESPDRIWELETWGALFDRTKDGRISQRNFGGHEFPRLAHVGDRTGLELIRTMQQKIVAMQQKIKPITAMQRSSSRSSPNSPSLQFSKMVRKFPALMDIGARAATKFSSNPPQSSLPQAELENHLRSHPTLGKAQEMVMLLR